jgi:hypothetical protein
MVFNGVYWYLMATYWWFNLWFTLR